jgi:O-acetyl-ADP-ribose deacetylase (regulator of RNase III)
MIEVTRGDILKGRRHIDAGLAALVADVRRLGINSIAVPPLGCGLGGLDWSQVRPRIEHAFAALPDVRVLLFEPDGALVPKEIVRSTSVPTMTPGRAVLVGLIERYLAGPMDPFVSLLEIHKLMYFMQEADEPLRLRYTRRSTGLRREPAAGALACRKALPDRLRRR